MKGYDNGTGQLLSGGVALLGSAIAWLQPGVVFKGSVSQVHAVCSSGIGALAQAMNPAVASDCGEVSAATAVIALAAVAGAALLVWGGLRMHKPKVTS